MSSGGRGGERERGGREGREGREGEREGGRERGEGGEGRGEQTNIICFLAIDNNNDSPYACGYENKTEIANHVPSLSTECCLSLPPSLPPSLVCVCVCVCVNRAFDDVNTP